MALMLKDFLQNAKQSDRICFKNVFDASDWKIKMKLIFCLIIFTFSFF